MEFGDISRGAASAAKRIACAACAVALAAGLAGCSLVSEFTTPTRDEVEQETVEAAVSADALVEEGVLTVAVNTSNAPQAMTDSDGEIVGYDIDVALVLASKLGLTVRIVSGASASATLDGSTADIFIGTSASNVSSDLTATEVYLEDATALFTDTSVTTVSRVSTSTLEDAVIAVQDSSASQDALLKAGITAEQQTYDNVNECFEALVAGEVDFVACDATSGAYLARMYADIDFVATISSTSSYCITCLASNTELSEAVVDALEDISTDGTLAAIHASWYGSLPTSLSDELLSGVTITDSDGDETSGTDEEVDEELVITGDINSLSS